MCQPVSHCYNRRSLKVHLKKKLPLIHAPSLSSGSLHSTIWGPEIKWNSILGSLWWGEISHVTTERKQKKKLLRRSCSIRWSAPKGLSTEPFFLYFSLHVITWEIIHPFIRSDLMLHHLARHLSLKNTVQGTKQLLRGHP